MNKITYWNLRAKRIIIDKYPRLARVIDDLPNNHFKSRAFPMQKLRETRVILSVKPGELIYIAKEGFYQDEGLFFPLTALLDNTVSFTAVKRWSKLDSLKNYCPYIPLSKDFIELV